GHVKVMQCWCRAVLKYQFGGTFGPWPFVRTAQRTGVHAPPDLQWVLCLQGSAAFARGQGTRGARSTLPVHQVHPTQNSDKLIGSTGGLCSPNHGLCALSAPPRARESL